MAMASNVCSPPGAERFIWADRFVDLKLQSVRQKQSIIVKAIPERRAMGAGASTSKSCKIYVGNLPWSCDSEGLAQIMQRVGAVEHVEEVQVVYDRTSGKSRGFGFVTLNTDAAAQLAVQALEGYAMQGRLLRANLVQAFKAGLKNQPREEFLAATKVFIGNLPYGVDDGSLEEFFKSHGRVLDSKVVYNRDSGRSRGFGFVTLSSPREANDAIKTLHGAECDGRPLRVTLADVETPENQ